MLRKSETLESGKGVIEGDNLSCLDIRRKKSVVILVTGNSKDSNPNFCWASSLPLSNANRGEMTVT